MRLRHPGGRPVFLSHGMNIRPAQDIAEVVAQLDTSATVIRARLEVDTLALGLWFPPPLVAALALDGRSRTRLRTELDARGLEVVTLGGRSYRGGGESAEAPHEPDWTTVDRLEHTLDLARVLVDLLPDDAVRGSVSTFGLGRREGWDDARERACARILGRLSSGLAEIAWHTGRAVRVGFEPEPGYVMDTAGHTVASLAGVGSDRLGVCLDVAGPASAWQDPAAAIDELTAAGVSIVKVQLTASRRVADPVLAGPLDATTPVWRAALRQLMAGEVPGCDQLDVPGSGAGELAEPGEAPRAVAALAEGDAAGLAYLRDELTGLGLVPPHRTCAAR